MMKRFTLAWMIVTQGLALLSLLPWAAIAMVSYTSFESVPETLWPVLFTCSIWAYPIFPVVLSLVAWSLYRREHYPQAALVTSFPLVAIFPLMMYFVYLGSPL